MGVLKKIYLLPLPLLLTGCYEDFTPEIDTTPVLCLNSLITAGEPISVNVTHTWLFTDEAATENHQVNDATITIFANNEKVDRSYIPQEGDRIRIVADSRLYGHAEAEVSVPVSVPIADLTWEAYVTDRWEGEDTTYKIFDYSIDLWAKLKIDDPLNADNYYHFAYTGFPEKEDSDHDEPLFASIVKFYPGTFHYEAEPIFSEHIGVFDAISGSDAYGFTFFTDRQFSGDTYTLNIQFKDIQYNLFDRIGISNIDDYLNCGFELTLYTDSQSYYNWSCYDWNASDGYIGDLADIGMSEPIWGYSNVSTGAGVVAAQSRATLIINLKDFLKAEMSLNKQ